MENINNTKKVTIIFCPYGKEHPFWADQGFARIGKKYIHFKSKDNDFGDFHKYEIEKVIIFDGWRDDIIQKVEDYKKQLKEYEDKKREFQRELEHKLTEMRLREYDRWIKENPYPIFSI